MRLIDRAFGFAKDELGQREIAGPAANPRIVEYHAATALQSTSDEVPWCSSFANWVIQKAGGRGTRSAAARSWLTWGREITEPHLGCIVILKRGAPPAGHVAFYAGRLAGGRIRVLGGNQSNAVNYTTYPQADVLGYRTSKD